MSIRTALVSSTQKKSCPISATLKVHFVRITRKWPRKKNARRKGNSNSCAMENAKNKPIGTLWRANDFNPDNNIVISSIRF